MSKKYSEMSEDEKREFNLTAINLGVLGISQDITLDSLKGIAELSDEIFENSLDLLKE